MKRKNSGTQKIKIAKLLFQILFIVALGEATIMTAIYTDSLHNLWGTIIIDPILLAMLITPALYFVIIKPLKKKIKEHKQAEEEIKEKSIELEKQIKKSEEQRIATLSILSDLNETTKELQLEITERKQSEIALKKSELHYRYLFNGLNDLVSTHDLEGYIISINPKAVNQLGYKKEEMLNKKFSEFLAPEVKDQYKDYLTEIKKEGKAKGLMLVQTRTGKKRIWEYNNSLVKMDNNEQFISGIARDVTDAKKAEKELKAINEFNKSLIETIPFGFDIVDMEGNILFMNNLLKNAIGIENPNGKCWELYKDNGKQCTECPLNGEMKLGETNICEIHSVLGGREFEVTHTVMIYKKQKALLEIFRDVTESKRAEKEILKLSHGLEQSPAMVVITDADGNIEFVNPKVTEFTGYHREELIGKNTSVFQSGKTPGNTYKELWGTILKGETWEGEILNKRKNGEEYWESVRISPILNSKGEIINYIGIKEDITEKIKAINELIAAKEKAEEMNKLKSNFLANMSHELRTPMVGILGFTEILADISEDGEIKEYAETANEAGKRLLESLNLILNLSKIESDKMNIEYSTIDVVKSLNDSVELFKVVAARKNISITFESNLEKLEIETDERMLYQIIHNLINNAVKYTDEGEIKAFVNKTKDNKYIKLIVKDTGIGIPIEMQEIIWQEFRQVSEGIDRKFQGTGLGLTVTKEFTHKLGGKIKLESEVGKGSKFTVLLPIIKKKK